MVGKRSVHTNRLNRPKDSLDTLRRYRTLEDFFQKVPSHLQDAMPAASGLPEDLGDSGEELPREGSNNSHQYAHAYQSVSNWGGESVLNIWSPYTERSNEFSLSQIRVVRGSGSDRETVEAGWQAYRDKYGDWSSHLFIYFTPDNYGSGGCYNNDCGKFVQVSGSIYPGAKFSNYSQNGGAQYTATLLLYKDGSSGDWWLRYGSTWVGYWPRSLFDSNGLRSQGSKVDFGGEIVDKQPGGRHTYTDMGSGHWPSEGWSHAAYQRGIRYVDTTNIYRDPSLTDTRTDSYCYDIDLFSSGTDGWKRYFYFGGSGYNTYCQ